MAKPKDKPKKYPSGKHPNSLKNLIPVKPGEVRNPKGRPVGLISFTKLFNKILAEETEAGKTIADVIVARMIKQALEGNFKQQNMIIERIDGKVPFRIAGVEGNDLFASTHDTIEKIFSNPKAMDLAIKLSNCVSEIPDDNNDGKGTDAGSK